MSHFRSKTLGEVYKEAIRQGFIPLEQNGEGHLRLRCPARGCGYTHTLSGSMTDAHKQKALNTIAVMRRHGFVWKGRGGQHTAPRLHRTLRKERETA